MQVDQAQIDSGGAGTPAMPQSAGAGRTGRGLAAAAQQQVHAPYGAESRADDQRRQRQIDRRLAWAEPQE